MATLENRIAVMEGITASQSLFSLPTNFLLQYGMGCESTKHPAHTRMAEQFFADLFKRPTLETQHGNT